MCGFESHPGHSSNPLPPALFYRDDMPRSGWSQFPGADPQAGWVPSPGGWQAPPGARAGKDWVPQGGATERLDRMPAWARIWSHAPFRAMGSFESWLWDHGGYDVEGAEATAGRERRDAVWSAQHQAMLEALDAGEIWPSPRLETETFDVVDVDKCSAFAVVVTAQLDDTDGGPLLGATVFEREDGRWMDRGGSAFGSGADPLDGRPSEPLIVGGHGWLSAEVRGGPGICHATIRCGVGAARVVIERPVDRRIANVARGSGWLGAVWREGEEPTIRAFDAAGHEAGVLWPADLVVDHRAPPNPRRRRPRASRPVLFSSQDRQPKRWRRR
jgi:hypothetical protein